MTERQRSIVVSVAVVALFIVLAFLWLDSLGVAHELFRNP